MNTIQLLQLHYRFSHLVDLLKELSYNLTFVTIHLDLETLEHYYYDSDCNWR